MVISSKMSGNEPSAAGDSRQTPEYLKLKVVAQDASEMYFRVKYRTAMRKVKKSYADHKNISVDSLRFLFDGRRICDEDTPESLEMTDEDVIEVFQEQTGGFANRE